MREYVKSEEISKSVQGVYKSMDRLLMLLGIVKSRGVEYSCDLDIKIEELSFQELMDHMDYLNKKIKMYRGSRSL